MQTHTSFRDILDSVRQSNIQHLIKRVLIAQRLTQVSTGETREAIYMVRDRALRQLARIEADQTNGFMPHPQPGEEFSPLANGIQANPLNLPLEVSEPVVEVS